MRNTEQGTRKDGEEGGKYSTREKSTVYGSEGGGKYGFDRFIQVQVRIGSDCMWKDIGRIQDLSSNPIYLVCLNIW